MHNNKQDPEAHKQHIYEQLALMVFPPAKFGDDGQLLPFQSYAEVISRAMEFGTSGLDAWFKGDPKTLMDELGTRRPVYFYHSNLSQDGIPFRGAPDAYTSYPAFHHALFIETFLAWGAWSGRREGLDRAIELADWNLAHSTPNDWAYGGMPYSTCAQGKAGGFVDGTAIMTDKAAIMGLAYLKLFSVTNDKKYLIAAGTISEKLAANQSPEGNWPFRVDPKTKEVKEGYTSSVIYAVMLFEEMARLSGTPAFKKNRDAAFTWILENPVKTGRWCGYYEDIPEDAANRTNWDCIDTARYLIAHRDENPHFLPIALALNKYISATPIKDDKTFVSVQHPYAPAEALREQKACFVPMSVHSAHWALLMADLAKATGDSEYLRRATQTMNYVTYHLQPDGHILLDVDPEHEKWTWPFNQFWFSIHYGSVKMLIEFIGLTRKATDIP